MTIVLNLNYFFFIETGDHVKCFCCDGALRNWEPKDDPWVEHARWFSRCNFLVAVKGNDYIKEIQARYQVRKKNCIQAEWNFHWIVYV